MSTEIPAIFENGVFRPLSPLGLPEREQVTLVVKRSDETAQRIDSELVAKQRELLRRARSECDALPSVPQNDALTNRDHDQIVYGSIK